MKSVYTPDGVRLSLHRRAAGETAGRAAVFQHGLGGDHLQTFETFPQIDATDVLTLDCRGHGASESAGPHSIATYAQDVDRILPGGAILGGISMGAAIATRLAVQRGGSLRALILVRPAWTIDAAPPNMAPVAEIAGLMAAGRGPDDFAKTETHARLAAEAPDNIASLMGYFAKSDPAAAARILAAIAADGPGIAAPALAAIDVPTLIIGSAEDAIHPLAHAAELARLIPGARFVRVPPKGRGKAAHLAAVHAAITDFLKEN